MRRVLVLEIGLFEPHCGSVRWSESLTLRQLENVAIVNAEILRCGRLPLLYQSGVRYIPREGTATFRRFDANGRQTREEVELEVFEAIPAVLERGGADCEDLSAWRVAELRHQGEAAQFLLTKVELPRGPMYHVRVVRASGVIEDPSALLGMGNPSFIPRPRVRVRGVRGLS